MTIFSLNYLRHFYQYKYSCIHGSIHGDSGDEESPDGYFMNDIKLNPIESLDIKRNAKCFTFFYKSESTYLNNVKNIFEIYLEWEFHYTWFPFNEYNMMSFAIHPPNVKPAQISFHKIDRNTFNLAIFSKVEEKRLMYYDDCREYNKSDNDFETRLGCLENCLLKLTSYFCHDNLRRNSRYLLFRDQLSNLTLNENINCEENRTFLELTILCKNKCQEDCYQAYYLSSIKKIGAWTSDFIRVTNIGGGLLIQPNSNPNIFIEHFAEITFISLVSNFGGLLGMYLGIS